MQDIDMRWLWAAYKRGAMADIMQSNMSADDFESTVAELIASVPLDWVIETQSKEGLRTIGLILADYRFGGHGIEPHILWFPWATPRNKLESLMAFLMEIGRTIKVFVYARKEDFLFWDRVWQYNGVLKKGCKITDCFGSGEDAVMYYTPGPF